MPEFISRILNRIRAWTHGEGVPSHDRVSRVFKFKYACFKDLLASNTELLNIITDFEQKLRGQEVFGMSVRPFPGHPRGIPHAPYGKEPG